MGKRESDKFERVGSLPAVTTYGRLDWVMPILPEVQRIAFHKKG